MSKERFKRMSEGFLKEVIEKFGTAVEVSIASTAKKAAVVASAWALLSAARKGLLEKDYSLEAFEMSEDEEKDDDEEGGGESDDEIDDLTVDTQHYVRLLLCKQEKFSGVSKPGKHPVFKTEKVEGEMTVGAVRKTIQDCLEKVGEGAEARQEFFMLSGISLAPGESLNCVDFYLKIAAKDGVFQNLDKDMQNLSSRFDPFDAKKQQFIKGKPSEEHDISSGASILVGVSVLKAAEEPTVSVQVQVRHPVIRKRENNNDELACTSAGTISSFTVQVLKKDVTSRDERECWDKILSGVYVVMGNKDGGNEDEGEEEEPAAENGQGVWGYYDSGPGSLILLVKFSYHRTRCPVRPHPLFLRLIFLPTFVSSTMITLR
jgi:hypothetical protein